MTHTTMRPRDRFHAILPNLPHLRADAITVLCGEDCRPRLERAAMLMQLGAAPTVALLGGRADAVRMDAAAAFPVLMGLGVSPDRILLENASQHTGAQAAALVEMAREHGWGRVIVVASAYHMPRAYLTCVRAIYAANAQETLHLVPAAANHAPWFAAPEGMTPSRVDLLSVEERKIDEYRRRGDCASYADGLRYLAAWEGR